MSRAFFQHGNKVDNATVYSDRSCLRPDGLQCTLAPACYTPYQLHGKRYGRALHEKTYSDFGSHMRVHFYDKESYVCQSR